MVQNSKAIFMILATFVVAAIFQLIFIFADGRDSPTKAALEFSKDYFLLNASMADRLCSKLAADEEDNWVKNVINTATDEARERGFEVGMVQRSLSHIEAEVVSQEADKAVVKISATSRVCINPVFAWVASLFKLGETAEVEAELSLVKEDGCWKVCEPLFETSAASV